AALARFLRKNQSARFGEDWDEKLIAASGYKDKKTNYLEGTIAKLRNHSDDAKDIFVKRLKLLCGNPVLQLVCAADFSNLESIQILCRYFEFKHITNEA